MNMILSYVLRNKSNKNKNLNNNKYIEQMSTKNMTFLCYQIINKLKDIFKIESK